MHRTWPPFIVVLSCLLALPAAAQQNGVHWGQDLEAAKAQASQNGRLVLIHFWTPSCAPCLALDQNVFGQPGVAGALESQFVPVKLNADENSATAQWYGITRVPTDVVITPDGQLVGKLVSPPTPMAYVAEVTELARKHTTRSGQTYANAVGGQQINAAYANLQVAPNTSPALAPPSATPESQSIAIPPLIANNPLANTGHERFASRTTSVTPQGSQPIAAAPVLANAPTSQPPNSAITPVGPAAPAPSQIANPYMASTTSAPAPPPLAPVQPSIYGAVGPTLPAGAPAGPLAAQQPQDYAAAAPPGAAPDASRLPPGSPPLGFEGYCPVSMRNSWKWVPGDPRWGIIHVGRTYWFAGEDEQKQFWNDPNRFTPALSGMDPVLAIDHKQQVPGKREHSIDYDGLFYMFASEATLQQFTANPQRYAGSVRQSMGIPRGRLVR